MINNGAQSLLRILAMSLVASGTYAQTTSDKPGAFTTEQQADGTFLLANIQQTLSAHVTLQGVIFDSLGDSSGKSAFTLSLVQWGSKGKLQAAKSSRIYSEHSTIYHSYSSALQNDSVIEKFSNGPSGIQQGFIVPKKLQSTGSLHLQLRVDGAVVNTRNTSSQNSGVTIILENGRHLVYDQLLVTDSKGKKIPAKLVVAKNNMINVLVDDAKANYPLTIHPTLSEVSVIKVEEASSAKPAVLPELPAAIKDDIKRLGDTSSEGLHEMVNPDGSSIVDLQGRFQSVPIAVIDSAGKVHVYMHGEDYKPGVVTDDSKLESKVAKTKDGK